MSIENHSHAGKNWWSRHWVTLTAVALVIMLDQSTKYLIRQNMVLGQSILEWSPVQLTFIMNSGGLFGLFQRQTLFLIIGALVGIAALFVYYRHYDSPPLLIRIALGMMIGGAIGNFVDRLRFGSVVDFIDARFWPVFNLADASIDIGILILVWVLLTSREKKKTIASPISPVPSTDGSSDKPNAQPGS